MAASHELSFGEAYYPKAIHNALEASVLVLNRLFLAIHIVPVKRAFSLLLREQAEVVSLEEGQYSTYDFATWREVSEYRAGNFREADDDSIMTAFPAKPLNSTDGTFLLGMVAFANTVARSLPPLN